MLKIWEVKSLVSKEIYNKMFLLIIDGTTAFVLGGNLCNVKFSNVVQKDFKKFFFSRIIIENHSRANNELRYVCNIS